MSSVSVSLTYKPLRVGFLVRQNNFDDLISVASINTLLWGGVNNPIIPVGRGNGYEEVLLKEFPLHRLYSIADSDEIKDYIEKYKYLSEATPGTEMLYEEHDSKKIHVHYLDILNLIESFWQNEFKHRAKDYKSDFASISWNDDNPLNVVFSLLFGTFHSKLNLKQDYHLNYLNGLRSQKFMIENESKIDGSIARTCPPLSFTRKKLIGNGFWFSTNHDGVFIGDEMNFNDLVDFWNARASGVALTFLSVNKTDIFEDYVKEYLNVISESEEKIGFYYSSCDEELFQRIVAKLPTKDGRFIYKIENGVLVHNTSKPPSFYFEYQHTLANVGEQYGRYSVDLNLPPNKVLDSDRLNNSLQQLAVSLKPLGENAYAEHTLKLPFIPELNAFYSRESMFNPWDVKVERGEITLLSEVNNRTLTIRPLNNQSIIKKVLEYTGVKSSLSQAGLLSKKIVDKLGDIEDGRVFKIKGVRELLDNMKPDDCFVKNQAVQIIKSDNFEKYTRFCIEPSIDLTPEGVFDYLVKKGMFRAGFELHCSSCNLKNWIGFREMDEYWNCLYCGNANQTVSLPEIKSGKYHFRYRKSGFFSKDNNQEGSIPVLLTTLTLKNGLHNCDLILSPSLNLEIYSASFETDLVIICSNDKGIVELGISECKSSGGKITDQDIANFKKAYVKMLEKGISLFFIFSKTSESFLQDEIDKFKALANQGIGCILFTNRELESLWAYDSYSDTELRHRMAFSLRDMAEISRSIYLK